MKVLYGVCGEGLGHAMRSAVVARHLEARGHIINFATSPGKAFRYLDTRWPGRVTHTIGTAMSVDGNQVRPVATLLKNVALQSIVSPIGHLLSALAINRPDVVISDFDPWTARYANLRGIPLIAIDNIHFMNRCDHPRATIAGDLQAAALMYPVVNVMVPSARRYMVTTFAGAPTRHPSTSLHLPILREEVFSAKPTRDNHIVAYFNDKSAHSGVLDALREIGAPVHLYGTGVERESSFENIRLMPASEGIVKDIASARAVIGGGGFTLMTEAIYLGKPMLAVPFIGQFEQILNANYLELMGYGQRGNHPLSRGMVQRFLSKADSFAKNLVGIAHDSNAELFQSLDAELASL